MRWFRLMLPLALCALALVLPVLADGGPCEAVDEDALPTRTYLLGDINGDETLDVRDAAALLRVLTGLQPNWRDRTLNDISMDGVLNVHDAMCLLQEPEPIYIGAPIDPPIMRKPVLYLYPEAETDVTVTLGHADALTCVYPAYDGGWRVTARPDGTLVGADGRSYYALYYEAALAMDIGEEGFVVPREELPAFLEEKLELLGLTQREAQELIVYWLPQMQTHAFVRLRFAAGDEIEAAMPLSIEPTPDTVLRVWLVWHGLEAPIELREQALAPTERVGFTAAEWGAVELPAS